MRRWVRKPSYFAFFSPMGEGRILISGDQIAYFDPRSSRDAARALGAMEDWSLSSLLFCAFLRGGRKGCQGKTTREKKGKRDYPQSTHTLLDRLREQIGKIPFSFVFSWRRKGKKKMVESPDPALQKNGPQHRFFILRRRTATRIYFSSFFYRKESLD